jgi:UPF0755 protein
VTDLDLGLFHNKGTAPPPRRMRRLWIRRGIVLVVSVALLITMLKLIDIGKTQLVDTFSPNRDYVGSGTVATIIQVTDKEKISAIGSSLKSAGVVRSTGAFTHAFAKQSTLTKLPVGYYQLRHHMSGASAVTLLLDPASRLHTKVTIPEGTSLTKVLSLIAKGTNMTPASLQAAAADPKALDLPAWAKPTSIEGFLYPLTYQFNPAKDAVAAMQQMVAAFSDEAYDLGLQDAQDKVHHSPYDVLTIASIIEKEAGKPADGPKVARVIYNRLAQHMKLQLDSTLNYVLPQRKGHLTDADLKIASPYNTYVTKTLPPTPIDSPGALAIKAALNPAEGNWTFFVTIDKAGDAVFTNDYVQFLNYKRLAKQNGVIS